MHDRPAPPRVITGIHRLTRDRFHRPVIDDGGLLWFGDQWVAVTDLQAPVVDLLLQNLDRSVTRERIAEAYGAAGGSTRDAAVMSLMRRLADHFTAVGAKVLLAYQGRSILVSFPATAPSLS